jgi:hypothetical protein
MVEALIGDEAPDAFEVVREGNGGVEAAGEFGQQQTAQVSRAQTTWLRVAC